MSSSRSFLFISRQGILADLAWTVKKEGHEVFMYIEEPFEKEIGDGFVNKVTDWQKYVDLADVIVFDHIGYGFHAEVLGKKGKLVIYGTPYTDRLENERSFGQEELKKHGIKILPHKEFHSPEDGIEYIKNNPGKYVLKPSGEAQNQKQLLCIGNEEDGSDIIRILSAYQKTWGNEIEVFQLQKKVTGVEIGVGAFFNGKKFLTPINVNFEHKKLFPGELGVSTGEMGTSMFWTNHSVIFDMTLKKMEKTLLKEGYVGYIDINCIVYGNGIYPLEFTCRFGHPTLSIQQTGIVEPMGELFYNMAAGHDISIKTKKGFQVGVLIVVPPFPYNDEKIFNSFSKDAVVVFKQPMYEGVHIQDLRLVENEWLITGSMGIALLVTGTGQTMQEAQKKMYRRVHNVLISNMYYRTDIGDRWTSDSDKLRSWGYL